MRFRTFKFTNFFQRELCDFSGTGFINLTFELSPKTQPILRCSVKFCDHELGYSHHIARHLHVHIFRRFRSSLFPLQLLLLKFQFLHMCSINSFSLLHHSLFLQFDFSFVLIEHGCVFQITIDLFNSFCQFAIQASPSLTTFSISLAHS